MTTPKTPNTSEVVERLNHNAAEFADVVFAGLDRANALRLEDTLRQAASTITRLEGERDGIDGWLREAERNIEERNDLIERLQAEVVEGRKVLIEAETWVLRCPEGCACGSHEMRAKIADFLSRPVRVGKEEELESARESTDRLCGAPTETEAGKYKAPPHTPGPWWVDNARPGGGNIQSARGPVAEAGRFGNTHDEAMADHANARLIAAAPDLLDACVALQTEARARGCGLRIADEAIAKASSEGGR